MIFETSQIINATLGGMLIGLSASLMLILKGRVTGISGIFYDSFTPSKENMWKPVFVLGLLLGGFTLKFFYPSSFDISLNLSTTRVIVAGLLVGFGTKLGSGCTSGHGVCGISRFSKRSLIATVSFISAGIITVLVFGVS
jgi:uncharacterized membrane protein YedE/YeeE